MTFRITPHRQYELARLNAGDRFAQGVKLQQDISSGVRVHKPSDDPTAQKIILNQQILLQQIVTNVNAVGQARRTLSDAQTQVQSAHDLLIQAHDIALQGRQATDESERDILARQLDSILNQLEQIANAQSDGNYLFGGTRTDVAPFEFNESGATYQGGRQSVQAVLPGNPDIATYYSGQAIFQPSGSGQLVISGKTGVSPGEGTSSGTATTTLILKHTVTTYSGASGIQVGTSSIDGDTVLGPSGRHQVTIKDTAGDGSAGTISLNGGSEMNFTSADADLKVTGPNGEVIYVDTQSIAPGFNGTVDLTADGTLSIDGGVTEVPIDFSANQTLSSDSLGVVQHFDTQNVTTAGSVRVEPEPVTDVFQLIRSLRDDVLNTHNLDPQQLDQSFSRRISELDAADDHFLDVIGQQSVDLEHLDTLESRYEDVKLNAQQVLNDVQSTDYATAITELQEQQNLLQFTLSTMTAISQVSLLDFIQ